MKPLIRQLLQQSLDGLVAEELIPATDDTDIPVDHARNPAHGDFASNIAMVLAKRTKRNPRELAELMIQHLPQSEYLEKAEIAGPGFINFFLKQKAFQSVVGDILNQKEAYGDASIGNNQPVLLEFVSANPTGPLHIGHGRGAAYGAAVAGLLRKVGFDVRCEYYINDVGRQMDILTISIWIRYLQKYHHDLPFPDNGYKGDYIKSIAEELDKQHSSDLNRGYDDLLKLFNEEDAETQMSNLITCGREVLNEQYQVILDTGLNSILNSIKQDLNDFGVTFDNWFSERSVYENNNVKTCIDRLTEGDWVYEKEGATWFCSSKLGDEKDRVLIRADGNTTYFASDIAYHLSKIDRGFETLIDIWGADHHGYIARVRASMQALGLDPEKLEILLVQFATLYRGKEKLQMSTRSGEFITLKELRDEVGRDAARFFYIMRKSEQHLDFDLELAKSESNDNPVYYIQYAHARICSVFRQLAESTYRYDNESTKTDLSALTEPQERDMLKILSRFTEVIENAATDREPHQLAYYLKDLANDFHSYYNSTRFLVEEDHIRNARLALIDATRQIIRNGLSILGVTAPEVM